MIATAEKRNDLGKNIGEIIVGILQVINLMNYLTLLKDPDDGLKCMNIATHFTTTYEAINSRVIPFIC